jgi:hypothetical protein
MYIPFAGVLSNKVKLYVKRGSLRPGACFRLLSRRKNMTLVIADKEYLFRIGLLSDGTIQAHVPCDDIGQMGISDIDSW